MTLNSTGTAMWFTLFSFVDPLIQVLHGLGYGFFLHTKKSAELFADLLKHTYVACDVHQTLSDCACANNSNFFAWAYGQQYIQHFSPEVFLEPPFWICWFLLKTWHLQGSCLSACLWPALLSLPCPELLLWSLLHGSSLSGTA